MFGVLTFIFIVVSITMVLVILVQRPQGGGLSGAFGGAGGGGADTVFGGRVGDALTWATTIIFAVFLLLSIWLNLVDASSTRTREAAAEAARSVEDAPAGEAAEETDDGDALPGGAQNDTDGGGEE